MRFYCHVHKRSFSASTLAPVHCEKGEHLLGTPPSDPSSYDIWEYCCDCQNLWLVSPDGPGSAQCPVCERGTSARYLCDSCNTITLESSAPANGRSTFFSLQGLPRPGCPGCRNSESRKPSHHRCDAYKFTFSTLRTECLFCKEPIAAIPSFPMTVSKFLTQVNHQSLELDFEADTTRFIPSSQGKFLLVEGGKFLPSNILLPNLERFGSREGYKTFEQSYICDEPDVGEIVIDYPATVSRDGDTWLLKTAGRLRVEQEKVVESIPTPEGNGFETPPSDLVECPSCHAFHKADAGSCDQCGSVVDNEEHEPSVPPTPNPIESPGKSLTTAHWVLIGIVGLGVLTSIPAVTLLFWKFLGPVSNTNQNNRTDSPAPTKTATKPDPHKGMVLIEGGEFTMGDDQGDEYERPAHRVVVQSFYMDPKEVTCGEYAQFLKATSHKPPKGWTSSACPSSQPSLPVTSVDWFDASAYAKWRNVRLPTEEEWEYAARGNDGRKYPWGNSWQDGFSNAGSSGAQRLVNVGTYSRGQSVFGLFDMTGNVWEWTSSQLTAYPNGKISSTPADDFRVIRGGSWQDEPAQATTTFRGFLQRSGAEDYSLTGFRCALSARSNR